MKMVISIQVLMFIFSASSMLTKVAALQWREHGFWSWEFISVFAGAIALLGFYAIFWQKVLKKVNLSIAYMSKGVTLFWALFWSILLFDESITVSNLIGLALIFIGIVLINRDAALDPKQQKEDGN